MKHLRRGLFLFLSLILAESCLAHTGDGQDEEMLKCIHDQASSQFNLHARRPIQRLNY